MNETGLLSVIIPSYNGARYLAAAIESVLAQAYAPLELIVVDDGSTDNTAEVASSFGPAVQYIHQPNGGVAKAANRGLEAAHGEWLGFCAADDLWAKGRLERQFAAFAAQPTPDLVFGHVQNFLTPELSDELKQRYYCPPDPLPGYSLAAMLARRSTFESVGRFNPEYKLGEFVDWYARAQERGLSSALVPEIVLWRRLHDDNLSTRNPKDRSDFARILKASMDRRRREESASRT